MEPENMQSSSFYRSYCTKEMSSAMKAGAISVNNAALPQSLRTAASLPGPIELERLSPEGATRKISKKRSRASKRTPTMVLNTDKANFKVMVQHFTGIPSANIAASVLSPNCESFEDYFLPKAMPAYHQQYSCAGLRSVDTNNPPFAIYASRPQSLYLPNFPFCDKSAMGMIPSLFNSKAPVANNSQRHGIADLINSASLWEGALGMDLPASRLNTNM